MSHRKVLLSNFLSLSSVQIANYILPLVTVPYLVRILGPEKFGLINFAQAFVSYFLVITNFGINISGAREIAIVREDKQKLSEVFSALIFGKFYLCILSALIFIFLLQFVPHLATNSSLFLICFGIVFAEMLFPVWFFQGMEQMTYIAVLNFIGRMIFTLIVFLIIKEESDYLLVPLLNVISSLLIGIISLVIVYKRFDVLFVFPDLNSIYMALKNSFTIFLSDVYVAFYTASYPVVLGFITNYTYVGYYTAAQKIVQAWVGLQNLIVTTLFPYMSKLATESRERAMILIQKITVFCFLISIPATLITFSYAEEIIDIVLGNKFHESAWIMRILSLLFVLILLNVHLTYHGMLIFKNDRHFNYARLAGGIIALVLIFPLSYYYNHIGTSMTFVLSEMAVFVVSIYLLIARAVCFVTAEQLKKIALFTLIVLCLSIFSLYVKNLFLGITLVGAMTVIATIKLFGYEFLMIGRKNV